MVLRDRQRAVLRGVAVRSHGSGSRSRPLSAGSAATAKGIQIRAAFVRCTTAERRFQTVSRASVFEGGGTGLHLRSGRHVLAIRNCMAGAFLSVPAPSFLGCYRRYHFQTQRFSNGRAHTHAWTPSSFRARFVPRGPRRLGRVGAGATPPNHRGRLLTVALPEGRDVKTSEGCSIHSIPDGLFISGWIMSFTGVLIYPVCLYQIFPQEFPDGILVHRVLFLGLPVTDRGPLFDWQNLTPRESAPPQGRVSGRRHRPGRGSAVHRQSGPPPALSTAPRLGPVASRGTQGLERLGFFCRPGPCLTALRQGNSEDCHCVLAAVPAFSAGLRETGLLTSFKRFIPKCVRGRGPAFAPGT